MKIIEIAQKEIGVKEMPFGSNMTKFGLWFGLNGCAWCGIFVSYVYFNAGFPLGNIGYSKGFAKVQTAVDHYRKTNEVTTAPQPGDIVFFDWNGDGRYDHTGIFVDKLTATTFKTIEGNTAIGNDSNGGQVMERTRKFSQAIFAHPAILNS